MQLWEAMCQMRICDQKRIDVEVAVRFDPDRPVSRELGYPCFRTQDLLLPPKWGKERHPGVKNGQR